MEKGPVTTARENPVFAFWRYAATYTAYGVFGIGALGLMGICFPVLRLTQSDVQTRQRRSRRLVYNAFRLFIAFLRLTRVVKLDLSDLGKTPLPSNGSILVANHPRSTPKSIASFEPVCSTIPFCAALFCRAGT